MRWLQASTEGMHCSFCRKSQDVVSKLISSPSELPRAYISGKCVAVCQWILVDYGAPPGIRDPKPPPADPPLLHHPLATQLFSAVDLWFRRPATGQASPKH